MIKNIGTGQGTTSAALPAGRVGDLFVVFAYRNGSATAPTLPSGWTNLANSGANLNAYRCGYLVATSTSSNSDVWTNATNCVGYRLRYQLASPGPNGGQTQTSGSGSPVNYNSVSLTGKGDSWLLSFAGAKSGTAIATRSGFNRRETAGALPPIAIAEDISGPSGSSDSATLTGTSDNWISFQVEILADSQKELYVPSRATLDRSYLW